MAKAKRVMGFGTFDAVHPGHLFYLRELKKLGDELTIVIARDKSVTRIKGKEPYCDEYRRMKAVAETGIADSVVLGDKTDFMKVIDVYKPTVLGFGYDQRVDIEGLKSKYPHIEMVRVEAHEPEKYKSSIIKAELTD